MVRIHARPILAVSDQWPSISFLLADGRQLMALPGDVAQLGEHRLCKPGVAGSIPVVSTVFSRGSGFEACFGSFPFRARNGKVSPSLGWRLEEAGGSGRDVGEGLRGGSPSRKAGKKVFQKTLPGELTNESQLHKIPPCQTHASHTTQAGLAERVKSFFWRVTGKL